MPTTALMPLPKQQFMSALGVPLVGGKLYTYAAGTSTPKKTYTDAAGTTAQPNPIPLNLRGEPQNAIYWSGNYRVELRNLVGDLIYSVDNFNTDPAGVWAIEDAIDNIFSGSTGSSKIGFTQNGVGAVLQTLENKLHEFQSVGDRGASSDGDAHDALQKALDVGYGTVGPKVYSTSKPLIIPSMSRFQGAKPGTAFIGDTPTVQSAIKKITNDVAVITHFEDSTSTNQDCIVAINPTWIGNGVAYPQKVIIDSMAFQGNVSSPNAHGLYIDLASGVSIRDTQFSHMVNAIYAKSCFASSLMNVQASAKFVWKSGTSMTFINVGSGSGPGSDGGFNIESLLYSTFISSWVDGADDTAWRLVNSKLAMISCGTETSTTRTADSGTSLAVDGNTELVLINHNTVPMPNQVLPIATMRDSNVVTEIHGCSDFGVAGVNCDDLYIAGSNSNWHYWEHKFVNGSRNNPIIQAKAGAVNSRAYVWFGDNCKVYSSDGAGNVAIEAHFDSGTWAPQIFADAAEITGGTRTGTWQKNRKLVTINGRVAVPNKGANTGAISITGWPAGFVPLGDTCVSFAYATGFTGGPITAIIDIGSKQMNLLLRGATGDVNMTNTSMVNGFTVYFSVTFTIA